MFKEIVVKIVYPDNKTMTECGIQQVLNYHFDLEYSSIHVEKVKNNCEIESCSKCDKYKNKLEDVVNELYLSPAMIEQHGALGTAPSDLVKLY